MTKHRQIRAQFNGKIARHCNSSFRKQLWWEFYNKLNQTLERGLSPCLSGQLGAKVKGKIKND